MARHYDSAAEAEKAFYRAFRELDTARMQEVWVASPTAYCIHPSGQLFRGYEAIMNSWNGLFRVAEKPQIQYSLISRDDRGGLAVHLVVERVGPATGPTEAGAVVFATNIYQLTEDGWRMLGHHAGQARSEPDRSMTPKKLH